MASIQDIHALEQRIYDVVETTSVKPISLTMASIGPTWRMDTFSK